MLISGITISESTSEDGDGGRYVTYNVGALVKPETVRYATYIDSDDDAPVAEPATTTPEVGTTTAATSSPSTE